MSTDLSHLTREQCLTLLTREELGRVGIHLGERPAILPVNYALLGEDIVFRTAPGSKLSAAMMQTLVSFEVDAASPDHASGWTVLVVGHTHEIRDRATRTASEELGIQPWAPGTRSHLVKIASEHVTGRAFGDVGLG